MIRRAWRIKAINRLLAGFVLLAVAVQACPAPAKAESVSSETVTTDQTEVSLISAVTGTGDLKTIPLGLHFTLKPGWKTYWRSPGDAGYPVTIDYQGSRNLAGADIAWPAPHRFQLFGLQTFGYSKEVVFPISARPQEPGQPMTIRAQIRYLVCETVCIPYTANLTLAMPAAPADLSDDAPLINKFRSLVPGDGARAGFRLTQFGVATDGRLVADLASDGQPFAMPDIVIEGPAGFDFGAPNTEISDEGMRARLIVPVTRSAKAPQLSESDLTITVVDGERALEQKVRPSVTGIIADSDALGWTRWVRLLPILAIALVGGLILNVMPCVLPVLALKLAGVADHAGADRRTIRLSFISTAAGVLAAFLLLALALVGLKAAGATIGWGIQFQQPLFLLLLILVCLTFAANLTGWFEIPLPAFIGSASETLERSGTSALGKSFLTGMLATLMATPCSAPFVGTAVGFALSRGAGDILLIFAMLGLGLALPYIVVALLPGALTWLPKPGRWMLWLKRVLALALIGSALWLGSILAIQLGLLPGQQAEASRSGGLAWQPFEEARIAPLVRDGKVVFVDVTAAWCVTCQANKRLVTDRPPVIDRLQRAGVVAMQADWTKPDDTIARYLADHGRYGIPFNIVYGPGAPLGIVLPELLTSDAVISALQRAGAGSSAAIEP
ncbi:protein-disulfide reductase DsbD family protein [Dongia soli]|uniref:Protein-disulfide reductase DsbD family protein n=1 Tax=Dongia soli TaxID=600628 RepID=A0ABU5ECC8_9PROT|nr:protein-disulfide reductase DsbD domain-containing protein [Dongia soli]MDY0883964.1 protein-disulfide reductase DsbD family protein [Dongia soli]